MLCNLVKHENDGQYIESIRLPLHEDRRQITEVNGRVFVSACSKKARKGISNVKVKLIGIEGVVPLEIVPLEA